MMHTIFIADEAAFCLLYTSMTCYWMGHLGNMEWIEKYFHVKKEKMDRAERFVPGSYTHLDVYKRQVLGRQTSESTQYGRQDFTVVPIEGLALADQLHDCLLYTSRCV